MRRLLQWKFAKDTWGIDEEALRRELVEQYKAATSPASQAIVLEEFDTWFQLDETTAVALYRTNRACSKFLLGHLPSRYSFWGNEKREMWLQMIEAALKANDNELALALYRRQVDIKQWQSDVERLAIEVADAERLNDALRKRHPEGWGLKLGDSVVSLLRRRGRDVMPYVREKLDSIVGGWSGSSPKPLLRLARERGWWDLWAAVVRTAHDPKYFNEETSRLLDDAEIDDATRVERLRALAGVSQEWNWAGVGIARVHSLQDDIAARLYQRYPRLVRGAFKPNIVPTWWQGGPRLLAAAQDARDDELIDLLASRYVTQAGNERAWQRTVLDVILKAADDLATSYQALRDRDEAMFAAPGRQHPHPGAGLCDLQLRSSLADERACAVAVRAIVRGFSGCAGSRARSARRFGDSRSDARLPRAGAG